jgi:hypothetical protein
LKTDVVISLLTAEQSFLNANYMTSEGYFSDVSKQGVTARSLWWKEIIQKYGENDSYCDELYANRLTWTIQRTRNPETSDAVLNVEVGTTGDVEHDTTCTCSLSLAIAAHPNVCSLKIRQRVKTHTVPVADWLTQSEVRDGTPFFDVRCGAIFAARSYAVSSNELTTPPCNVMDAGWLGWHWAGCGGF